ncbi:hypothetical protein [Aeromonas dhakensis]|uniref:hypothetical protein n=1 Tax=Aeromonas dhakensis TaxID=196024 RepID=UPI003B9ED7F6
MKYDALKIEIEKSCKIVSWNPSQQQLEKIAIEIELTKPTSAGQVEGIVASVCPGTTFMCLEGVDNSDVRTLLALAIQASKVKK